MFHPRRLQTCVKIHSVMKRSHSLDTVSVIMLIIAYCERRMCAFHGRRTRPTERRVFGACGRSRFSTRSSILRTTSNMIFGGQANNPYYFPALIDLSAPSLWVSAASICFNSLNQFNPICDETSSSYKGDITHSVVTAARTAHSRYPRKGPRHCLVTEDLEIGAQGSEPCYIVSSCQLSCAAA